MTKIEQIGKIIHCGFEGIVHKNDDDYNFSFKIKLAESLYQNEDNLTRAKKEWENQEHNGDCINQCCTCAACWYHEEIIDIGAKFGLLFVQHKLDKEKIKEELSHYWFEDTKRLEEFDSLADWIIEKYKEL